MKQRHMVDLCDVVMTFYGSFRYALGLSHLTSTVIHVVCVWVGQQLKVLSIQHVRQSAYNTVLKVNLMKSCISFCFCIYMKNMH